MLYLDEVVIHNFKSFKHATIKFNQGFNCIVGPNGSGKSNICDSLLFALGETSLKRMRVSSSAQLINSAAKPSKEDNVRKAYVKVKFSGDKEVEILRAIKSNKKVAYRLNSKRATRQEVIEVLREFNGNINETNTMTQGEITYLLNLTPKERRELIDIAAGIKEFNDKKDVSLKELNKVDEKINESKLILSERSGFLGELEKEKKDAEKYIGLAENIKQLNYSVLKLREQEVESRYRESIGSINEKTSAREKLGKQISAIEIEISSSLSEKERISKSLNAKSAEAGSTGKILEEVNKNMAVDAVQLSASKDSEEGTKERIGSLQAELKKLKTKEKENSDSIKKQNFELEVKGKNLPDYVSDSDVNKEASTLTERFNSNYKKIEELEAKLLSISSDYAQHTSEYESLGRSTLEMHKSMNEFGSKRSTLTSNIKSSKDAMSGLEKSKMEVEKDLTKEGARLKELREKLDVISVEHINLREALAHTGSESSKVGDSLAKELGKVFHGKAQDICSYDDKYALAVQSAAGGRFAYFVVDNIDVASKAVGILKAKKIGRASFIPIKEITVKGTKNPDGLKPILDYLKFDKKYEKVMSYIFSNTYLVDSIGDAQKKGIGSYRFVTLEGDIVEPSGIVSGGLIRIQSSTVIDGKLKKLEAEKKDTVEKIAETEGMLEMIRKKIANYQMEIINYDIELKHALASEDDANRNMDSLNETVKKHETSAKELKEKIDIAKVEKERAETSIKQLKEENAKMRITIDSVFASKAKTAKSKEDAERIKTMRDEIEKLKIGIASTTKENDMLASRIEELDKEIKGANSSLHDLNSKTAQLEKEIESLSKQRSELQASLETHDKKTSGMFKELQVFEDKISKRGAEKGKLLAESDRIERDLIELEGRKAQMQTRLNDIKAELISYPNMEIIQRVKMEEMEKQLIITKAELDKLGAVNLKAPEAYELRKRDVDEAQKKMEILESEKNSINSMIDQIETKKLAVFTETFNAVNVNFQKLYSHIFDGSTSLHLKDPKDPFNSGLEVSVEILGKKHNPDQLSGGQKSLIALMLVFAIQMRVPMSFYIFDEIDVALDKENSKKLSKLIKELSQKSQFIVVSHNDTLIAAADTAVGVVSRTNESQVVGIQLAGKQ